VPAPDSNKSRSGVNFACFVSIVVAGCVLENSIDGRRALPASDLAFLPSRGPCDGTGENIAYAQDARFDSAGLVAVAACGAVFAGARAFIASPVGTFLLFCWSLAFFYHLCSGIRHLAWDAGYGFEIRCAYRSGYIVLTATVLLTALAWLYVFLA
jgi:succinate dehydrogenase cytochrome b556 subunit